MSQGMFAYAVETEWETRAPRARTMNDLLRHDGPYAGNVRSGLEELHLHAAFAYPTIALFDVMAGEVDTWTRRQMAEQLFDLIKQAAPGRWSMLPDDNSRIGIIFPWDDRESIVNLYHSIPSRGIGRSPRTITLGISNPSPHLKDLHQCYEQARFAIQHRFYDSHAQPIFFGRIHEYAVSADYPEDKEDDLLHILTGGVASASAEQAVDAFYEALLAGGPLPESKLCDATLRLLVSLQLRAKSELGQSHFSELPDMTTLMRQPTLIDMKHTVCEALKPIGGEVGVSENMNRTLIKRAVTLMEDEYDKVSLHYVAEKVFITPTYLSTLFKSKMGITFIEHLTHIRIANAKKLLKQTHLKNYEVAERVGYHDSRYFSQIFKKKVGVSPSEFRDAN
ncbi:helix-turn-helix domain-containing protein [Paenibacillus sp. LHD-117]|uniref:helix-turn-helix domain-containing protein n=1 Tax=Paenibacillus sp. LHD-117 TaxID=3071412 RepID=UPI0027E13954|nr:helix-turn-helix domain-containing protein [Paenibacillus sp. LHD-117]MDQ6419104.1 helix-turn-helix domain-containing protein [Paenibacillus sp. LHD-117]